MAEKRDLPHDEKEKDAPSPKRFKGNQPRTGDWVDKFADDSEVSLSQESTNNGAAQQEVHVRPQSAIDKQLQAEIDVIMQVEAKAGTGKEDGHRSDGDMAEEEVTQASSLPVTEEEYEAVSEAKAIVNATTPEASASAASAPAANAVGADNEQDDDSMRMLKRKTPKNLRRRRDRPGVVVKGDNTDDEETENVPEDSAHAQQKHEHDEEEESSDSDLGVVAQASSALLDTSSASSSNIEDDDGDDNDEAIHASGAGASQMVGQSQRMQCDDQEEQDDEETRQDTYNTFASDPQEECNHQQQPTNTAVMQLLQPRALDPSDVQVLHCQLQQTAEITRQSLVRLAEALKHLNDDVSQHCI